MIARLIGKPIGILLGVWLALGITKEKNDLVLGVLFIVGLLGTLDLSVSLLFAQLSWAGPELSAATVGVIVTLPMAILLAAIALRSRAKYLQR